MPKTSSVHHGTTSVRQYCINNNTINNNNMSGRRRRIGNRKSQEDLQLPCVCNRTFKNHKTLETHQNKCKHLNDLVGHATKPKDANADRVIPRAERNANDADDESSTGGGKPKAWNEQQDDSGDEGNDYMALGNGSDDDVGGGGEIDLPTDLAPLKRWCPSCRSDVPYVGEAFSSHLIFCTQSNFMQPPYGDYDEEADEEDEHWGEEDDDEEESIISEDDDEMPSNPNLFLCRLQQDLGELPSPPERGANDDSSLELSYVGPENDNLGDDSDEEDLDDDEVPELEQRYPLRSQNPAPPPVVETVLEEEAEDINPPVEPPVDPVQVANTTKLDSDSMMKMRGDFKISQRGQIDEDDAAGVELLSILLKANAPLRLYNTVVKWAKNHTEDGIKGVKSRSTLLGNMVDRYNLNHLKAIEKECYLPYLQQTITVTCHDFTACLMSLLQNEDLMKKENLLFDLDNPGLPPTLDPTGVKGDVNTGSAYVDGWLRLCKGGNDVMIPIILFIDGTFVDARGRHQLEPVCFTLACFNYETRCKPEAWRTLGFIKKNLGLDTEINLDTINGDPILKAKKEEKEKKDKTGPPEKVPANTNGNLVDYHAMLGVILEDLYTIQQLEGGLSWTFEDVYTPTPPVGDSAAAEQQGPKVYQLRVPFLFIMGDTMGHNKLAGLRNGASTENPQCRMCDCSKKDLDNPFVKFTKTDSSMFTDEGIPKNEDMKYHYLTNNILRKMQYCDAEYGLNGALVPEALHFLLLGYYPYSINGLSRRKRLNKNKDLTKNYVFPTKDHTLLNETCRVIGENLRKQTDSGLPRTHFPTGYLPKMSNKKDQKTSKKCGHEMPGVILCIMLMLLMDRNYHHYELLMGKNNLNAYLQSFELLLLIDQWMSKEEFTKEELDMAETFLPKMMESYKLAVDRQTGNGMKIIKFHLMLHIVDTIRRYGAIRNVYGGIGESMLKYKVKQTARKTLMSAKTFESHTAMRDVEAVAIERASVDVAKTFKNSILRRLLPPWRDQKKASDNQEDSSKDQRDPGEEMEDCMENIEDPVEDKQGDEKEEKKKIKGNKYFVRWVDNKPVIRTKTRKWALIEKEWKGELTKEQFNDIIPFIPSTRNSKSLTFHTEHRSSDNKLYRANPVYRGPPWQSWATCRFQDKELPCQLLLFFYVKEIDKDRIPVVTGDWPALGRNKNDQDKQLSQQFSKVTTPGSYALIHYCPFNCMEDPGEDEMPFHMYGFGADFTDRAQRLVNPNAPIVRWCTKDTDRMMYTVEKWPLEEWNRTLPHIGVIPVGDIISPITAIKDLAGRYPHQYLFLEHPSKWGEYFVDRMRETELIKASTEEYDKTEEAAKVLQGEEDGLEDSENSDFAGSEPIVLKRTRAAAGKGKKKLTKTRKKNSGKNPPPAKGTTKKITAERGRSDKAGKANKPAKKRSASKHSGIGSVSKKR